ncbi:tol-pal system protein YbgF [Pseudoduganella flava]|uniref:Cell division coordinator CpoB n=1 Tax=Pseudoduganella flava TaxID=871742 RepID=A0A562PJ42_9BURK|nr:tol-pal system protein YbgF [Pseudoduganella flava]QGZ41933.1 tol-pal system protein YbgF [Pseudoduganella flava]TWI44343.1 tol-pal system protein YbgF [Pseudoduganella flava]
MIKFTKTVLALAAATFTLHASAGVFDDDEARRAILDLRNKVEALTKELNSRLDTKADKTSTLDLINQHEQTMQEIARLRGQVEVLQNEIEVASKRQKDFYADLDKRLRALEPRQVEIDGQTASVDQSEQNAYDAAMQQFKDGNYDAAATALQNFVRRYPGSAYAANAQYWLGNAYYAQRDCKNAILAQQQLIKTYPDSPKAPDAMLNIASCQAELKAVNNAKKTLNELMKTYPNSAAAKTAKERLGGK